MFTKTVMDAWNALPRVTVEADRIVAFKRPLDGHINMEGYGPLSGRGDSFISAQFSALKSWAKGSVPVLLHLA